MAPKKKSNSKFCIDHSATFENVDVESQQELMVSRQDAWTRLNQKIPHLGSIVVLLSCFFYVTNALMIKLSPNFNGIIMLTMR